MWEWMDGRGKCLSLRDCLILFICSFHFTGLFMFVLLGFVRRKGGQSFMWCVSCWPQTHYVCWLGWPWTSNPPVCSNSWVLGSWAYTTMPIFMGVGDQTQGFIPAGQTTNWAISQVFFSFWGCSPPLPRCSLSLCSSTSQVVGLLVCTIIPYCSLNLNKWTLLASG